MLEIMNPSEYIVIYDEKILKNKRNIIVEISKLLSKIIYNDCTMILPMNMVTRTFI